MKRIWLFGATPLPIDSEAISHGAGIRTWQFLKSLLRREDVTVDAICLRADDAAPRPEVTKTSLAERFTRYDVPLELFKDERRLRSVVGDRAPDVVIGVGSILPVFVGSRLAGDQPFWADFFGDPLAEIQSKAELSPEEKSRDELFHVWKLYNAILHRADKFSAVSEPQRHALIGHLGLAGRLNRFTVGYEFVHTIPCGVDDDTRVPDAEHAAARPKSAPEIPPDAFVMRWSGSYNTWADATTLFEGLERAMHANHNILYLSTGGGIKGYNEKIYDEFVARVARSKFRERFILRGWVPNQEVAYWDARSDLGINIDRFTHEGVLGSRNRIIQFLRAGIPVLTTPLSEVSRVLAERALVHTFPIGDAEGLAAQLVKLAAAKSELEAQARAGKDFVVREYGFARTVEPFMEWFERAAAAPDNAERARRRHSPDKSGQSDSASATAFLNEAEHWSHFDALQKDFEFLHQEKHRLDALRNTLPYKLLSRLKRSLRR